MKRQTESKPVSETDFISPIRRLFPKKDYRMLTEVPFNGKHIDVLLLSNSTGKLVAIELKMRNWKRALRQAAVYQLCANSVYVALWGAYINENNREAILGYGIGLIAVEAGRGGALKARVIAAPKRSGFINKKYSQAMRARFKEIEE